MSCKGSIRVCNTTQTLISSLSFIPTPCRLTAVIQNSALLLCSTRPHSIWPFTHMHCSTTPCWTLDQLTPTSKNSQRLLSKHFSETKFYKQDKLSDVISCKNRHHNLHHSLLIPSFLLRRSMFVDSASQASPPPQCGGTEPLEQQLQEPQDRGGFLLKPCKQDSITVPHMCIYIRDKASPEIVLLFHVSVPCLLGISNFPTCKGYLSLKISKGRERSFLCFPCSELTWIYNCTVKLFSVVLSGMDCLSQPFGNPPTQTFMLQWSLPSQQHYLFIKQTLMSSTYYSYFML